MQPASRGSLAAARERLDELADGAGGGAGRDKLTRLGDELAAVAELLLVERGLRRSMVDPSASDEARRGLIERLFGSKVDGRTLETLTALVASRWSRSFDLVDALEELGRQALLAVAEYDGTLEEVEDELFRFGRIVAAQPQLADLLSDLTSPASRRVELLEQVLGGKVSAVTMRLLEQAVRSPRGRHLDQVAEQLVEMAAARRERRVAHVTSPLPLSGEQQRRLADVLGRIYRRPMSLQIELDPDLLGGLVIRVGDEVIDGSVAERLARARQGLPR